jgi:hypothetical protein
VTGPLARPILWPLWVTLLTLSGGCGYHVTGDKPTGGYQWRSLYREDVRTVAVPIFTTKDFTRGAEFTLSKAVAEQIEARTPYKIAPRERADTILEGEIASVSVDSVSRNRLTATPQEQLLIYSVNFTWKDLRSGRILVRRRNFRQAAPYYPTLGEGRFVGTQHAAEELAVAIVQEMQADW